MAWRGMNGGMANEGWRIDPETFILNFNEESHPRSTDLLYEIQWGRRPYNNFCTNQHHIHAEINFLENEWSELMSHRRYRMAPCNITWFLSWSPCGLCSYSIVDFLEEHPNVTLEIRAARLYRDFDERNRIGLRNLNENGVTITIMNDDDFSYCWDTFVEENGVNYWAVRDQVFDEDVFETYSETLEQILNE